jgi:hypothetical protein
VTVLLRGRTRYAAVLAGTGLAVAAAFTDQPYGPYAALVVVGNLLVVRSVLRAALPALLAAASTAPALWDLLLEPYLVGVWQGAPGTPAVAPATALTFALLAVGVGLCYRAWAAVPGALAVLASAAALDAPWPTVPALSLAVAAGAALAGALRWPSPALAVVTAALGGAGLAGMLATESATLTALAGTLVVAAVCGVGGRGASTRYAGLVVAVAAAGALGLAAPLAADLPLHQAALWVLVAAAAVLAGSALLRATESVLVETGAHVIAAVALLLTVGSARYAATVCALWGVAVGVRALVPSVSRRTVRVAAAAGCELLGYWLILAAGGVTVVEAYTLPAAAVALLAGWLAARARPELHSWTAYGPALLAGFGPSTLLLLDGSAPAARRLGLGLAALAVVVAGSVRRRQAPVVVGGVVLAALAAHEVALVWDLVPRWIPLAAGGLLLVGVAMTYERSRRDVGRLRSAVARMH